MIYLIEVGVAVVTAGAFVHILVPEITLERKAWAAFALIVLSVWIHGRL